MRISVINHAALPRLLANKTFKIAENCYKLDQDKKVCFESTYVPSDYVFVDRPPLTNSAAKRKATEGYL